MAGHGARYRGSWVVVCHVALYTIGPLAQAGGRTRSKQIIASLQFKERKIGRKVLLFQGGLHGKCKLMGCFYLWVRGW